MLIPAVQEIKEKFENMESAMSAIEKQIREMEEKVLSIMMENNERLRTLEVKIAGLSKDYPKDPE